MSTAIGTDVVLCANDLQLALNIATARADASEVTEAAGVRQGTYTPLEIELVGAMSEIAAAFYYDVEPDLVIARNRSEPGADITVDGWTCNIKATTWSPSSKPHLLVRDYDNKYDIYLLACVGLERPHVRLIGYATRKMVQSKEPEIFRDSKLKTRIIRYEELIPVSVKQYA